MLAGILALSGIGFGLPYLFRPDEDVMVGRAVRMAVEGSSDPLFYNYPPLVFFLLALAERVLGLLPGGHLGPADRVDPSLEYLVARLLSAAAFVVAAALVYRVAAAEHGRPAGLLAGVVFALAPLSVRQGHFATTDMISTAFVAGGMCAANRIGSDRGALLGGALAGLGIASKYSAGLVLVYLLVYALRSPRRARVCATVLSAALVVLLLSLALTGQPLAYLQGLGFLAGRAARATPGAPLGFVFYPLQALPFGLGLGAVPLLIAGLCVALLKRSASDLAALLTIAAGLLVLGPSHEVFYRYLLPLFPALALLVGGLLRPGLGLDRRAPASLAALLLLPSAYASVMTDRLLSQPDTRQLAGAWLLRSTPPGAGLEVSSYWSQPFYDAGEAERRPLHPLYLSGDPVADSFELGRYSDHFAIDQPQADCYSFLASEAPDQGPPPAPDAHALARFSPGNSAAAVYDPYDSFYLPVWGFAGLDRPGPAIAILRGC